MPCRLRFVRSLFAAVILALPILALTTGCSKSSSSGVGETTDPKFAVPDGPPDKILEFVKELRSRKHDATNQQEMFAYTKKFQSALIQAGDKILAQQASDEATREAVALKLSATLGSVEIHEHGSSKFNEAAKTALEVTDRLRHDKRAAVAEVADDFWIGAQALNYDTLSTSERTQLADDAVAYVKKSNMSQEAVSNASYLASRFVENGETESAATLFEHVADVLGESKDQRVKAYASTVSGKARQLRLPGSQLQLEGTLLKGGTFDWESYRGKVVLVDFWATWCGPCVEELPNVQAQYRKYHSRGFEVVGISLDRRRRDLESFVEKRSLPWAQIFEEEIQEKMQQGSPMAIRYGVTGIPTALLVDAEGKVVSVMARGDELGRLLEKMLGKDK